MRNNIHPINYNTYGKSKAAIAHGRKLYPEQLAAQINQFIESSRPRSMVKRNNGRLRTAGSGLKLPLNSYTSLKSAKGKRKSTKKVLHDEIIGKYSE